MAVYKDLNKTKDGRCWYFKVYKKDNSGNNVAYKSKRYLTKHEAQDEERLFLMKRDNPTNKNFSLVALSYFESLSKIRKESTVYTYKKDYKNHLEPFFGHFDINSINSRAISQWFEEMDKKGLSVAYKNKIYNILKKILDFAIKYYGLQNNYASIFGRFQKKNDEVIKDEDKLKYITIDEFNKFISVVDNELYKTFFIFAMYTGCRKGEMFALTWNDIDFNNNIISINKTLNEEIKGKYTITSTKNNLNRKIKMSKLLSETLLHYKNIVMQYKDFKKDWFVFGNSIHLSKTSVDRYKHKYFKLSGVHEITMHEFRHSHVSLLINEYVKQSKNNNVKIDSAKFFLMMSNRLGHTIDVMQKTYMHLFPTIQDEIVDLLDNL